MSISEQLEAEKYWLGKQVIVYHGDYEVGKGEVIRMANSKHIAMWVKLPDKKFERLCYEKDLERIEVEGE